MPSLGQLLGLITIGQSMRERPLLRQMLSGVAAVVTLTIVVGMMVGGLMMLGLYGLYSLLLSHGLEPSAAMWTIAGVAVLSVISLALATISYLRHLFDIPRLLSDSTSPLMHQANAVVDSFVDGVLTKPNATPAKP